MFVRASTILSVWLRLLAGGNLLVSQSLSAEAESQGLDKRAIPVLTNLLQLRSFARTASVSVCSFDLCGVVCAVDLPRGRLALRDDSDVEILNINLTNVRVKQADKIKLKGTGITVIGTEKGLSLGTLPVVRNDGLHPLDESSGAVYLKAGLQPIRLHWFNHLGQYGLSVEYEGPELARRAIADSDLFRLQQNSSSNTMANGLRYAAYEGVWHYLPDFSALPSVRAGIAINFNPTPKTRNEDVGLQFDGFLKVPRDGVYKFYLKSDDGSDLSIGESPQVQLEVLSSGEPVEPGLITHIRTAPTEERSIWTQLEGEVTAVLEGAREMELDVRAASERVRLILMDSQGIAPSVLRNARIRATGICRIALTEDGRKIPGVLLTLTANDVQVLGVGADPGSSGSPEIVEKNSARGEPQRVLTTVEDVRRLSREQANQSNRVKVRGVLTCIRPDYHSLVIQDQTRGIYAHGNILTSLRPELGQYWEIEATTEPGEFAPVLQVQHANYVGTGQLPEPIHPTWDQLMNGSLDTQYVELQGIITESDENKIVLLTRGGKINIGLPDMQPEKRKVFELALVRLRGCLFASWDPQNHQVKGGEIEVYSAAISAEEAVPVNPFAAPTKTVAELKLFDPQANVFQRAKVCGQIVHGHEGNFFLMNGTNGIRFICKSAAVGPGDVVEVAGLPEWSGLSPILRETVVRKTGHAPFPKPKILAQDDIANPGHDSTLVSLEAMLVNSRKEQDAQVLELQSGLRTFLARVKEPGSQSSLLNGSRLKLQGIYVFRGANPASGLSISSFEILLNSFADITVIAHPPWWTIKRVMGVLGAMAVALLAGSLWVFTLKRRVRAQTNTIRQQIERHATMEERARIAREFHDTLEQALAGIGLQLNGLAGILRNAPAEASRILEMARSMVRHGQEEAKRSVRNLRTFALEQSNLSTALSQLALQARNGWTGNIEVGVSGTARRLPARVETHLLRIAQESVNNAIKHGAPKNVRVDLAFGVESLRLSVADDGCGFDTEQATGSSAGRFGLPGMRERAEKIGGELRICSDPGAGAKVELWLPFKMQAIGTDSYEERKDSDSDS